VAVIRGGDDAELTKARPIARIWFRRKVNHTLQCRESLHTTEGELVHG
jgi:hypothetical protein